MTQTGFGPVVGIPVWMLRPGRIALLQSAAEPLITRRRPSLSVSIIFAVALSSFPLGLHRRV